MRVNALLVRYEGGYRESSSVGLTGTDGSPLTTPGGELLLSTSQGAGRLEGFVNYPEDSAGEADRKAASTIASLESARWQTTVGIEPTGTGDVPLTDWDVADTITVPDQDGSPQVLQVTGLLLTEDEAGHPVYRPRVGDRIPSVDGRRATTNRNFNAGDLGGRDPQAMPRSGGVGSGVAAKVATPAIGGASTGVGFEFVAAGTTLTTTDDVDWASSGGWYSTGVTVSGSSFASISLSSDYIWSISCHLQLIASAAPTTGHLFLSLIGGDDAYLPSIDVPYEWFTYGSNGYQYDVPTMTRTLFLPEGTYGATWDLRVEVLYSSFDKNLDVYGSVSGFGALAPSVTDNR